MLDLPTDLSLLKYYERALQKSLAQGTAHALFLPSNLFPLSKHCIPFAPLSALLCSRRLGSTPPLWWPCRPDILGDYGKWKCLCTLIADAIPHSCLLVAGSIALELGSCFWEFIHGGSYSTAI